MTMDWTKLSPVVSHPKTSSQTKWFLIIILGLIVILGLFIAAYLVTYSDDMGVTVIRMEGTIDRKSVV